MLQILYKLSPKNSTGRTYSQRERATWTLHYLGIFIDFLLYSRSTDLGTHIYEKIKSQSKYVFNEIMKHSDTIHALANKSFQTLNI